MSVLQVLRWLLVVAEVGIAGPILYLCMLSFSAVLAAKKRRVEVTPASARLNFAILIPAHNEEVVLGTLLESLTALEYQKDLYTIYVVADNCTDRTAELARATGRVHVYERFDQARRGKGYALNWVLQKLEKDQLIYDAYVILDADSVVEPAFLQLLARELARGAQALQARNTVLNTVESPSTALRWIALTLINHVRPLGRTGLGSSSTLTGNGMCLSHSLLKRYPWQSYALSEDYQYYLWLIQNGERVCYVPEAVVRSEMPTTFAQMRTQDVRWEVSESGQKKWSFALRLLVTGLRHRDFVRIEAVAELLTPPLSFLAGSCLLTLVASLLSWSLAAVLFSLILLCGLTCYISTALYLLRPPRAVYMALLYAPGFMIWKLWVYFVLSRRAKHTNEWVRTSRISR
jgi:cellulose synthase/poly-beta-1,6-N-acetylglucosamine synthase-like glycosyltransferase